ncbi:hypothetical protein NPIL_364611 [Nephila pilipes]|uniref:Uncharacterized protein n=1 Tax=Nephila pilipes TaxID=299642 RepID=A0A8X6N6D9_NEPPI|nr:hypothetical protein NPIL_364611 [Nephila pilipes]
MRYGGVEGRGRRGWISGGRRRRLRRLKSVGGRGQPTVTRRASPQFVSTPHVQDQLCAGLLTPLGTTILEPYLFGQIFRFVSKKY